MIDYTKESWLEQMRKVLDLMAQALTAAEQDEAIVETRPNPVEVDVSLQKQVQELAKRLHTCRDDLYILHLNLGQAFDGYDGYNEMVDRWELNVPDADDRWWKLYAHSFNELRI